MKAIALLLAVALSQSSSMLLPAGADRVEYRWHANGRLESVRLFHGDKQVGRHLLYWPDGAPRLDATYADDAYDGEYRTWYSNGRRWEVRHFTRGIESGRQQAWTPTGALYLNYDARDGRHFGLVNAKPCLPVHGAAR